MIQLAMMIQAFSMNIGVYFEEQNIDTLTTDSEMFIGLYSVMAQSESENISANVKWGVRQRMKNGTFGFHFNTYGYRKGENGEPEVVPEEAEHVKKMFDTSLNIYNIKLNIKQLQDEAEDYMMKAATTEGDKSKYLEEVEKIFAKVKVLREQLEVLEATSSNANENSSEINRLTDILKTSNFAIEEYDDLIVRRTIECIRVMSNKTIIIIFKGGFEMTESLEDIT